MFFWTLLGDQPGADVGPLISPQAKERVCSLIQSGVEEGAKLLLDGRKVNVKGYENGYFVGPTIIANVTVRGFDVLKSTQTSHQNIVQMRLKLSVRVCTFAVTASDEVLL